MLRAGAAQQRLHFDEERPKKKARRLAVAQGFSLHADTAVHAFDKVGLRKLCGYGAWEGVVVEELSYFSTLKFEIDALLQALGLDPVRWSDAARWC